MNNTFDFDTRIEHSTTLAGADSAVNALAFSSTGQFLASGDDAGVIAVNGSTFSDSRILNNFV